MYRERWHFTVSDMEAWDDCVRIYDDLNKLSASKGRTETTCWTETVGPTFHIILESDFPDLATYQKEWEEWNADPEFVKLLERFEQLRHEGHWHNELLETVEPAVAG